MVQEEWRDEMEQSGSLRLYRKFKWEMREEHFEEGMASRLWFAARVGCLRLECRRWNENSSQCKMCGAIRKMKFTLFWSVIGWRVREEWLLSCGDQDWRVVMRWFECSCLERGVSGREEQCCTGCGSTGRER